MRVPLVRPLHLVGLVIFLAMHGVSMAVSFWVRGQTERATIVTLLMLSSRAVQVAYLGLILLGVGGWEPPPTSAG